MVISWQLMIWAQAQAGNRASKTGHYLQWRDTGSEWLAETSAVQKLYHFSLLFFLFSLFSAAGLEPELWAAQKPGKGTEI